MSRTKAPAWLTIATLALGATLLSACGGGAASAVPSVAPATAVATPQATPSQAAVATPSLTPVDVGAVFTKALSNPSFSATADLTGSMTIGALSGEIGGDAVFSGGDSSLTMTVDFDTINLETGQIQVGDQKWSRTSPGPWLEGPKAVAGSGGPTVGSMLQSLVKVTDLGVVTKAGRSLHHLQVPGMKDVSSAFFGVDPATTKDATFSLDFYATDEGVPAIMTMSGEWTQTNGATEVPTTLAVDIAFDDVGTPQTVSPPDDVWVRYTSKSMGYSMAHPADWTVSHAKNEDTYSVDGQGYVYVATSAYAGSTAKFASELKASYKKPFKGDPASETPKQLGGVPAVRLVYEFTNDTAQDVTIADDVVSRDGTGWEVYLATAGGQEDIDIFDTFVATFIFTE